MFKLILAAVLINFCVVTNAQRLSIDFLAQVEGFFTNAYCLSPTAYPLAGVTIGIGVDFGSKTAASLRAAGVKETIITQVTRYFGLKGQAACNAVAAFTVVLTSQDALDLSNAIITQESDSAAASYNSQKLSTSLPFDSLTCAQKTVIASVLYQYGSPTRVPRFWSYITSNNWNSAIAELRNFGDAFATRRNKEADLLQYTGTTPTCPVPGNDICKATRGSCVTSTTCTKVLLNNFCQNQAASVKCCV